MNRLARLFGRTLAAMAASAVLLIAGWLAWALCLVWFAARAVVDDRLWGRVRSFATGVFGGLRRGVHGGARTANPNSQSMHKETRS